MIWIIVGILAVLFVANFIMICPDKLPWRKKNDKG